MERMKVNNKTFSKLITLFAIALTLVTTVSCNNKKGNSSNKTIATVPWLGCTTCFDSSLAGHIYTGQAESNLLRAYFNFYGSTNVSAFSNPLYPPITSYSGASMISGWLDVKTQIWCGSSLVIPAGRYEVRTATTGVWNNGVASTGSVGLQAGTNGIILGLTLQQAVVGAKPSQYSGYAWFEIPRPHQGGMYMRLQIDSVNNMMCGGSDDLY